MSHEIEAIFLDVGNTLRTRVWDKAFAAHARRQLVALAGAREGADLFFEELEKRWDAYRKWSRSTRVEWSDEDLWTRWLLPDHPREEIAPIAASLGRLWRDTDGRRVTQPDARRTVLELKRRGYLLGIVANAASERAIPDWLESEGLTNHFTAVVVSSSVGHRKPAPEIYREAIRRIGVEPGHCAFVGDNPVNDVVGPRQAGFAMTVLFRSKDEDRKKARRSRPDRTIRTCRQLLNIFPARKKYRGRPT